MAINTSSGYIGLGSRLFLGKESSWGTRNASTTNKGFNDYNIYSQAGSRPQKVTTPIEVSQLYPSMLRRKPIKNSVSVEGSYTFAIPTSNFSPFLELITGDSGTGAGTTHANVGIALNGTNEDEAGSYMQINNMTPLPAIVKKGSTVTIDSSAGNVGTYIDTTKLANAKFEVRDEAPASATSINLTITPTDFAEQVGLLYETNTTLETTDVVFTVEAGYLAVEVDITGDTAGASNDSDFPQKFFDNIVISEVTGYVAGLGRPSSDITGEFSVSNTKVTVVAYDNSTKKIKLTTSLNVADVDVSGMSATVEIEMVVMGQAFHAIQDMTVVTTASSDYVLKEEVKTSYEFCQTIGLNQLSLYTGMMAQSATINVTPDDLANVEISFLGQDEVVYDATQTNIGTIFGTSDGPDKLTAENGKITASGSGLDNCTEFYPSWAVSLFVNKKTGSGHGETLEYWYPSGSVTDDGSADTSWTSTGTGAFDSTVANSLMPFSDLSITINNNLEFPTYINGTKTRNQPVQTTYKEVTGSITVPYNEYTRQFVKSMFDQDSFQFQIKMFLDENDNESYDAGEKEIIINLMEVCITGDSLADIPEGEMTLPINFTAYASKTDGAYDNQGVVADSPIQISLKE